MLAQPTLSICVPSRNRQRYFQETIRSLLINMRTDVEFVFADNSDDPVVMRDFMTDIVGDPRVKFIPPGERVYSMVDNWERCLEAATGEYVCVIGDDDYVDINVVDLINRTKAERASVDVFVWSRFTYNWPGNRRVACNVAIPLGTGVHEIKREWLYEEFFTWKQHGSTPSCPFAIYHGAVSKAMMDKIKSKFGGRYFEHPTVDFENSCKLLVTAEGFFYSERPFSILGACAESNSASIGNMDEIKRKQAIFMKELGRDMNDDAYMADFPFHTSLGVSACVAQVQIWFKATYGHRIDGWERNFAEACGYSCGAAQSREFFDLNVAGYEAAFKAWKGGKYLKYFKPKYISSEGAKFFFGVQDNTLFIDENTGGVETPAELYQIVEQILVPLDGLELKLLPGRARAA